MPGQKEMFLTFQLVFHFIKKIQCSNNEILSCSEYKIIIKLLTDKSMHPTFERYLHPISQNKQTYILTKP